MRLHLGSLAYGDGRSAAGGGRRSRAERPCVIAKALRTSGFSVSRELVQDVAGLSFLCELDEIAAAGGDVRTRLFGA